MKNRKLNLNSIKVKSFVTNLDPVTSLTVQGKGIFETTWNIYHGHLWLWR